MTAIKKTRLKFAAVTYVLLFVIVAAFCAGILGSTYSRNINSAKTTLERMTEGFFSQPADGAPEFSGPGADRINGLRGFTVKLDENFEIIEARYNENIFSATEITEFVTQIKESEKTEGSVGDLRFLITDVEGGKIAAALDTGMENTIFNELLLTVLLAGGGGLLLLTVIIWFLSFWVVRPAAEALQKQKRFISEAGHELKTPLTVISASLDLIERAGDISAEAGRIKIIKEQTEKMRAMTDELLTLSKTDETNAKVVGVQFDLSQTVLTEVLAYESVAFERGKTLDYEADENLTYKGDAGAVRQAIGILCDNAIKHSNAGGTISVFLKKQGQKNALSVSNGGSAVTEDEIPLLFERFYRGSESRAEPPGSGLGLAILKTLAERNGWKLNVKTNSDAITFSIIF